jgi:hypothetical protein
MGDNFSFMTLLVLSPGATISLQLSNIMSPDELVSSVTKSLVEVREKSFLGTKLPFLSTRL